MLYKSFIFCNHKNSVQYLLTLWKSKFKSIAT